MRRFVQIQALAPRPRAALAPLCLGLALGCAAERRYTTLSFFFDGVPDPHAPVIEEADPDEPGSPSREQSQRQRVASRPRAGPAAGSVHPPYAGGECDTCHAFSERSPGGPGLLSFRVDPGAGVGRTARLLAEPVELLCVSCHDAYGPEAAVAEGLWLHGPVGAGACTFCHDPHRSGQKRLLRASRPRELCLQCHAAADLAVNEEHPSLEELEDEDCTACHDPHRGTSRYLL